MVLTFLPPRLRPTLVQGLFALAAPLCGIGSLSLSGQLLQQHLSRDVWRHIFLIWLSLHNCLHTWLSVDVFGPNLGFSLLDTHLFGAPLSLASAGDIGTIEVQIWFGLIWLNVQGDRIFPWAGIFFSQHTQAEKFSFRGIWRHFFFLFLQNSTVVTSNKWTGLFLKRD